MLILIAGGAASGKSTLADALASSSAHRFRVLHLDEQVRADLADAGPFTAPDASGKSYPDINHPAAFDWAAVSQWVAATEAPAIVEGLFALSHEPLRRMATLRIFVDAPSDIRLGRKIVRNYKSRGKDPAVTFRNYLTSGRPGHDAHVEPSRARADLMLNGLTPTGDLVAEVEQALARL